MIEVDYLRAIGVDPTGWDVRYAKRAGVVVGLVMTKGCEVHIHSMRPREALSRKNIRDFLGPLLERHGYVTTRVPRNVIDHRLREHLGFVQTWADDRFTYWALTELPYSKREERSCQ